MRATCLLARLISIPLTLHLHTATFIVTHIVYYILYELLRANEKYSKYVL